MSRYIFNYCVFMCMFLLWYDIYILCIQIKDYLMQNLCNCTTILLSSLLRIYHHHVIYDIYENWKYKSFIRKIRKFFKQCMSFYDFDLQISFHTVESSLGLRWNRRTTERLREGQEPWSSRHGLNRGRVYFFLTSIRHSTELRLWNGIYVLRFFIWSFVFFFFFWCYYRSGFIQESYSYWHSFLATVPFKSVPTTEQWNIQSQEIIKIYSINSGILHRC